jgi:TPR repeat protein
MKLDLYKDNAYLKKRATQNMVNAYKKAADLGHLKASYQLATLYENGIGVRVNLVKAKKYYFVATQDKNDPDALFRYAYLLENGTGGPITSADLENARKYYCQAALQNHIQANFHYALMLNTGKGGIKDETASNNYLKRANELNLEKERNSKAQKN